MVSWKRWASWVTTPAASLMLAKVTSRTSWPSIVTEPEVTSYSRDSSVDSVVFPAPDGPTSAVIVPGSTTNEIPCSTSADGSADSLEPSASSDAIDTAEEAGYRKRTSSATIRPLTGLGSGIAPGLSSMTRGASSTSNTRSKDTRAVSTSTRVEARSVRGEYSLVT